MAQQQRRPKLSKAEKLLMQWQDFRTNTSRHYDTLAFRNLKWPTLSMAWLPHAWRQPAAVTAAQQAADARRAVAHRGMAAGPAHVAQPMPVQHSYLLLGEQTSGAGASHVVLMRVELAGQLAAQDFDRHRPQQQQQQQVAMQECEMTYIMRIPHGALDVNRLAVMPSDGNLFATCCDEPEVFVFDLRRQQVVQDAAEMLLQGAAEAGAGDNEEDEEEDKGGGAGSDTDSSAAGDTISGRDADSDADGAAASGPLAPPHPQAVLSGRSVGGFGLEFHPSKPWVLLGADMQGGVQLWDVQASSSSSSGGRDSSSTAGAAGIPPMQVEPNFVRTHDGRPCGVNDMSWHRGGTAYALATESGQVWVQDIRAPAAPGRPSSSSTGGARHHGLAPFQGSGAGALIQEALHVRRSSSFQAPRDQQHQQQLAATDPDCLCVAFDPCHEHRLASGGADGHVLVLDMRQLGRPTHQLSLHAGSVTSVAWSPKQAGLLVTGGEDGWVLLWDVAKMGQSHHHQQQQPPRGAAQQVALLSQPGLLWPHGAHLSAASAVALHPDRPWLVASASAEEVMAPDAAGESVCVQRRHCMVWEVNRASRTRFA